VAGTKRWYSYSYSYSYAYAMWLVGCSEGLDAGGIVGLVEI
jgi:hypothetical protein